MEKETSKIPLKKMDQFTAWVLLQQIIHKLQSIGKLEKEDSGGKDGQINNTKSHWW